MTAVTIFTKPSLSWHRSARAVVPSVTLDSRRAGSRLLGAYPINLHSKRLPFTLTQNNAPGHLGLVTIHLTGGPSVALRGIIAPLHHMSAPVTCSSIIRGSNLRTAFVNPGHDIITSKSYGCPRATSNPYWSGCQPRVGPTPPRAFAEAHQPGRLPTGQKFRSWILTIIITTFFRFSTCQTKSPYHNCPRRPACLCRASIRHVNQRAETSRQSQR